MTGGRKRGYQPLYNLSAVCIVGDRWYLIHLLEEIPETMEMFKIPDNGSPLENPRSAREWTVEHLKQLVSLVHAGCCKLIPESK